MGLIMRSSKWLSSKTFIAIVLFTAVVAHRNAADGAPLGYFPPSWYSNRSPSALWRDSDHPAITDTQEVQLIKRTLKELSRAGISKSNRKTCITKLGIAVSKISHKPPLEITSTSSSAQLEAMVECCADAGLKELAEDIAHCSLSLAQQQGDNKESVQVLDSLAGAAYKKGNCDNAAKLLNQALEIQRKYSFKGPSDTGLLLNHLAFCYARAGKFEDSERALKQAIKSDQERMGDKSFAVAEDTYNLGVTEAMRGDFQQAEVHVKRGIDILSELAQERAKEKAEWSKFHSEILKRLSLCK